MGRVSEEGGGWEGRDVPVRVDGVTDNLQVVVGVENVVCILGQVPNALLLRRRAVMIV